MASRNSEVLALSERRRRITPANSSEFIALLETLVIVIDEETPSRALGRRVLVEESFAAWRKDPGYVKAYMR
jgi:hypothetical protein